MKFYAKNSNKKGGCVKCQDGKKGDGAAWNEPIKQQIEQLPRLYETENTPLKDKLIYLLGNNYFNAEWGDLPFDELWSVNIKGVEIECETAWMACGALRVEKISLGNNW